MTLKHYLDKGFTSRSVSTYKIICHAVSWDSNIAEIRDFCFCKHFCKYRNPVAMIPAYTDF